jgi:TonB family protein
MLESKPIMSITKSLPILIVGISLATAACATRPTAEVDAANAAVASATAGAGTFAADSVQAAQAAKGALDAELRVQDQKFLKSYDRTRELAAAAKAAGEKASADAAAAREAAEAKAAKARADAAAAAAARAKARTEAVRIGREMKTPTKIKDVRPIYPAIAQAARAQGTVVLEATIGPDGKVADTRVVRSVPLLDQAAIDAVRQWEYTPTRVKGKAVPVVMTITINFTRP